MKFFVYRLYRMPNQEWIDEVKSWKLPENQEARHLAPYVVDEVVTNECSDTICIGAKGNDGKYYQFDSYEAYHAANYFTEDFETHGLFILSTVIEIADSLVDSKLVAEYPTELKGYS